MGWWQTAISLEAMQLIIPTTASHFHIRPTTLRGAFWLCFSMCLASGASGDDWMTWPSTYTHDSMTAQRVDQYALPEQPLGPSSSAAQRSGYRHYRSTLQAGQSVDNMHIVEEWGKQVLPYEQWRFPYRPYGVPYPAWGPQAPYGIFNGQFGFGHPGFGHPGHHPTPPHTPGGGPAHPSIHSPTTPRTPAEWLPGTGVPPPGYAGSRGGYGWNGLGPGGAYGPAYGASRGFPLQPNYLNQPWFDGTYPPAPPSDRRPDAAFFYHPPLGRAEQPTE
jgi:hypothetical protein